MDLGNESVTIFTSADDGRVIGLYVPATFGDFSRYMPHDGARAYVTDATLPLQLAVLTGPKGSLSDAHIHDPLPQIPWPTRHTAIVCISGSVRVFLSDRHGLAVAAPVLSIGDTLLFTEGHQLELLEEQTRIIEVKQGPYPGSQDADRRRLTISGEK